MIDILRYLDMAPALSAMISRTPVYIVRDRMVGAFPTLHESARFNLGVLAGALRYAILGR